MNRPELSRLARLIPVWLLVAIPLAFLRPGNDYVMQPKVAVAMSGAALLIAVLAAGGALSGVMAQPILVPLTGVVVATLVAIPGSVNLPQAVRLFAEQCGWAALALGATIAVVPLDRMLPAIGASIAIVLWIALDQLGGRWYVGHGDQFGPGRIYATLGNPSFFGVWLAPVAVWLLVGGIGAARTRRPVQAAGLGAALAATLFLMLKAAVIDAWAGLAVGGAVSIWLMLATRYRNRLLRPTVYAGLVFAAGTLAAAWVLAPFIHDRLDYLKVKAFSWHAAAWLWRDHPILGAGPGGFQTEAPLVMARVHALWTKTWGVTRSLVSPHDEAFAHQEYLQMLAEVGVLGAGMWCWLVAVVVRSGWHCLISDEREVSGRIAWLGGLAAFIPTMALHFPLHLAPPATVFWLSVGWAGRRSERYLVPFPDRKGARYLLWGSAAAALLVCVIAARGLTCNVLLGEGYRYFRGGAPHLAAGFFDRFERLSGRNYEERFYAGAVYQALHDEPRAIESYERAVALYPGMQGALYNLGNVYFNRGAYDQAAEIYSRVLAINPDQADALNNLGNCYGMLGKRAEAEKVYLKAVAIDPGHVDALYNLAVNAYRMKRRAEARKWLARTLAIQPQYPAASELAGMLDMPK